LFLDTEIKLYECLEENYKCPNCNMISYSLLSEDFTPREIDIIKIALEVIGLKCKIKFLMLLSKKLINQ